ncbi:hypothetical protein CTI14_28660 [Methylobacterium radiotolerans]|nr:hypothetical protein CTI14_28660 [Methylobacterium radiotolerans]
MDERTDLIWDMLESLAWPLVGLWVLLRTGASMCAIQTPWVFSAQVGQEMDERTDLIWDMLESLAWPLVGLWVLLGLINWFLIWRLLRPLARMARGIETKSPSDLSPVAEESRAHEVQSITAALNRLLGRLDHALEAERRFTADAAPRAPWD